MLRVCDITTNNDVKELGDDFHDLVDITLYDIIHDLCFSTKMYTETNQFYIRSSVCTV